MLYISAHDVFFAVAAFICRHFAMHGHQPPVCVCEAVIIYGTP